MNSLQSGVKGEILMKSRVQGAGFIKCEIWNIRDFIRIVKYKSNSMMVGEMFMSFWCHISLTHHN